jgi:hypothetical protein
MLILKSCILSAVCGPHIINVNSTEDDEITELSGVGFEVSTAVITISWNLTSCSPVDVYQHFRGIYCLHLQE